jgi:hypothetical protein
MKKMRKNSLQEEFPNFESILAIFVVVEREVLYTNGGGN